MLVTLNSLVVFSTGPYGPDTLMSLWSNCATGKAGGCNDTCGFGNYVDCIDSSGAGSSKNAHGSGSTYYAGGPGCGFVSGNSGGFWGGW